MGKEILERKFKNGKLLLDENLDLLAKTFNFKTRFDLVLCDWGRTMGCNRKP